jgi:hypothetical protein
MAGLFLDPIAFIAIVVDVVLAMLLLIGWFMMPKTAKFMLMKKLMMMQGKTLNLVAYDDRFMQMEAFDVTTEALLESKAKHGLSKNFYLAKPQDESQSSEQNLVNSQRDIDYLPPYNLEGIPVYFSHISKAVATNPKVLVALRLANQLPTQVEKTRRGLSLKRHAIFPKPALIDNGVQLLKTNLLEVNVSIPFDPVDIKKNFPLYWQQSNIDATKRRNQGIGEEKAKRTGGDFFKIMIVGAIVAVAIIAGTVIALRLIG